MKIGMIGCGVMGSAIAKRLAVNNKLFLYDHHSAATEELAQLINGKSCHTLPDLLKQAECIILGVKPKDFKALSEQLLNAFSNKHLLVSLLAGTTLSTLKKAFGEITVLRLMPNLAVAYGEGVIGLSTNDSFDPDQKKNIVNLFSTLGLVKWLPESMMDAFTSLAGSGPAFALVMIEAMIDASIAMGFNQMEGQEIALQMLRGTVTMLEESKSHPGQLKWQIASPGGTTIAGLKELEALGARHAIIKAFITTRDRAKELSQE